MLLIATIVGLGSQINLTYTIPGFIITLAVILLVTLMYIFEVNYYKTILLTAIISPLIRGLILSSLNHSLHETITAVAPDVVFYVTFGAIFYLFDDFVHENLTNFIVIVFFSDILSNIMEITFRLDPGEMINHQMVNFLFVIALLRSSITLISLLLFKSYHSFLKKEEHEQRYKKLLLLNSYFKSEIYFMNKNIDAIEEIMRDAYKLHKMSQNQTTQELSLDIANNIHEVKKDYIRVIDGLNEITGDHLKDDQPIALEELIDIILINTKEYSSQLNKTIHLNIDHQTATIAIKKHYFFISILRNLINNAIESIRDYGTIDLAFRETQNYLTIQVKDNGIGIQEKNLPYVFNFGYSTKFKDGDGKSQRGIGLSLVKRLVETKFDGTIDLCSSYGESTTFQLKLKKAAL